VVLTIKDVDCVLQIPVPIVNQQTTSTVSLGVPGKNPVSVLNEYAQKISKRLTFESKQSGVSHKPV